MDEKEHKILISRYQQMKPRPLLMPRARAGFRALIISVSDF